MVLFLLCATTIQLVLRLFLQTLHVFLLLKEEETLSIKDADGDTQAVGDVEESVIVIFVCIEQAVLVTSLMKEACPILRLAIFISCLL